MVLGGGSMQKLFQIVEVNVKGKKKIRDLTEEQRRLKKSSDRAAGGMNNFVGETDRATSSSKEASGQFGKMFGVGMNLMFMGMALQQVFGGLAGSMLETVGVTETFGAAAQATLLPFFIAIAPLLNRIAFFFMQLPKPIKMALGAFVSFLAVLGTFMFFGAQVALLAISLNISLGLLAATLLTVAGIVFGVALVLSSAYVAFERFGLAAGLAAGILSGAVVAALLQATGAFNILATGIVTASTSALGLSNALVALNFSASSLLLIAGALALSILLLNRVFKKFGPAVGLITGIIAALLVPFGAIAGAVLVAFAAFKAVTSILNKLGGTAKVIFGIIVAVLSALVLAFFSAPIAIGLAIGALLAVVWSFKDEIINIIKAVIDFVLNLPTHFRNAFNAVGKIISGFVKKTKKFLKNLPGILKNFFVNAFQEKIDAVKNIFESLKKFMSGIGDILGGNFKKGFKKVLEGLGGVIRGAINTALPLGLTIDKIAGFIDSGIGGAAEALNVNDFILTSSGQVLQPDSNDTIVGFNGNGPIQPGEGGGNVTVEINDPVMKEDIDVQRVVDEVEERVNRDSRGRSGGL